MQYRSVSVPVAAVLLAVVVNFWGPWAKAEEPADGPKVKFEDPFMENLVGEWDLTRSIRGQTIKNTVRAEWVLNHQFLQIHMTDAAVPPAYEALVLIGYSHADHRYVAHWCDVFGGKYSAIGYGTLAGNQVELAFQYDDGPTYNQFIWNPADKSWTFRMENADKQGKRTPFATDVLHRVGARP
ncbi:MAG: DUF1579 family protein [Thermoanaerobaculia bacterium]